MKRTLPKSPILCLVILFALTFFSCTSDNSGELYETAQFEELQKNYSHARQLYDEIIKKYPESEFAEKARKRLSELK